MRDYEDAILDRQESEADQCAGCPYKGRQCNNQCEETQVTYNPYILAALGGKKW